MEAIETAGLYVGAIVGAVLALAFGRSAWRGLFPGRWHPVAAQVMRAYVEGTRAHGTTHYTAMVEYTYRIGGRDFRGDGAVAHPVTSRGLAEDALAPYPVGHVLTIEAYRPDPRESRMGRSQSVMAAIGTVFGIGFVVFAVWMLTRRG
jgi:hypothetical protein